MKILLTGVTGYIGKRLLPVLLDDGHEVIACVRDKKRFDAHLFDNRRLKIIKANFLKPDTLREIPDEIDVAYYLIHSMSSSISDFETLEKTCAENFKNRIQQTKAEQVIYLSGIVNEDELSDHLQSRKAVEEILSGGSYHLTTLRAGIIVGSGSASFEIIRDLVEKLPVMVAPKWLKTRSQPIAVSNVIQFLKGVLLFDKTYDQSFDIGGADILSYKEMMQLFAKARNLKRSIYTIPVMTPKLSSYWLYFVTSTSYKLAVNLVDSMKIEIICRENYLKDWLNIQLIKYEDAVKMAFDIIEQQAVLSSWKDALSGNKLGKGIDKLIKVPVYGCFKNVKKHRIVNKDQTLERIWSIGGKNGWYYATWLWELRGFIDKLVGGVGLNRGRKNQNVIKAGESIDFWRVVYASKEEKRLLLYAEMKLPGEAWLEFNIENGYLNQISTFRPKGLWGRIYWYVLIPFHQLIFKGMLKKIAK